MGSPRKDPDKGEGKGRTMIPPALRIAPISYRVDDAALALGISTRTVWELIKTGDLPAKRLGRATVIRRRDLHAYVNGLPAVEVKAAQ